MNHLMRTLISLAHLTKAKSKGGQIATLLLLLLVIMLIFVMVTVNLGNVAVDATRISNASDSAVLQLASNLATKAKMLHEGLLKAGGNGYEKCQKTGLLAIVLAIIVAIIITVVSWGSAAGVGWAAVGGAIAGAVGGAIAGTGVLKGAITGAIIGFSIGSLGSGIQNIAASGSFWGGISTTLGIGATSEGFMMIIPFTAAGGAAVGGTMAAASTIYTANAMDNATSEQVAQLQKDLAKLNETDRFRESAFYTALSQVVDDPNLHPDWDDIDADTNKAELIPRFAWWWHQRMVQFANVRNQQIAPLNSFLADMKTFRDYAYWTYAGSGIATPASEEIDADGNVIQVPATGHSPGYLERADYKWSVDNDGNEVAIAGADIGVIDGVIVGLLWPLHNFGYDTTWTDGSLLWERGPAPVEMNTWLSEDCNSIGGPACSPPPSTYDYLDTVADDLRQMVGFMNAIVPPTFEEWIAQVYGSVNYGSWGGGDFWRRSWMTQLQTQYNEVVATYDAISNWESWRYYFYNPGNPSDPDTYYYKLQNDVTNDGYIDILNRLKDQLIDIRDNRLPACNEGMYDTVDPTVCNACVSACDVATCTGACHWTPWLPDGSFYWHCVSDCGGCALNPPCRPSLGGGTIDMNTNDEFGPAIAAIDDLIGRMTAFRTRIKDWSDEMNCFLITVLCSSDDADAAVLARCSTLGYVRPDKCEDLGGFNPITYRWTDMRGDSRVVVQAGPFVLPNIETRKYGNKLKGKTCSVLVHHRDEDNCWIKVTRYPPTNVSLGALGRWNPFVRGVSKVGKAYYAVNSVGLKAKNL